jgi:hypothetical protein
MIKELLSSCAECPTHKGRIDREECSQKKSVDIELAMVKRMNALPGNLGYLGYFWSNGAVVGKWDPRPEGP